ncbi:MAG: hypothetical protein HY607_03025 [Planctomycetes bacterium]|nr:hypothetical protein [Planctomycetota bacterium]MBI4221641.1 hypothetical protein [Planctomycetota bacterium]
MCAAPGGKTTHIAELLGDTGRICALDISLKRLQLIQENCRRLGVQNVFIVCSNASGERVPFHIKSDRVLYRCTLFQYGSTFASCRGKMAAERRRYQ